MSVHPLAARPPRASLLLFLLLPLLLLLPGCRDEDPTAASPEEEGVTVTSQSVIRCELRFTAAQVQQEVAGLRDAVGALQADGTLNGGQARALGNHLDNASASVDRGNWCAARAQLAAFREQVEDFLGEGILPEDRARPMIRVIDRLLNDRPAEILVDPGITPVAATIPGVDGGSPRPLARYLGASGRPVDFVENELYLMTDDPSILDAFLARWSGVVLRTMDFSTVGVPGASPVHLVRIDPAGADVDGLSARWTASAGLNGVNGVSSEAALRLLAVALEETVERGLRVGINFLVETGAIPDRSTGEGAGTDPRYSPDAFTWPYMSRGSPQDIGTAEAWRVMEAMGLFGPRVRIGIADGGFRPNADLPDDWTIVPGGGLRVPNPDPGNCGGEPRPACTWHGTHVSMVAAGRPDNAFGAAGPAGPVAELVLLQSPNVDVFTILEYILASIPTALAQGPRIVNISASTGLASELCLLVAVGVPLCETLHAVASAFRAAGVLVVAAAGNDSLDVDRRKVFGIWPFEFEEEEELRIPCELTTVLCVGGLAWNATTRDPGSNWGSNRGSPNTVRMFGPFEVWSVADAVAADDNQAVPDSSAGLVSGTSFASPYVAGVAGLVWAADPTLSANDVEHILLSTAHTHAADPRVPRWVNALGAVRRAVGGNTPPFIRILNPTDGASYPRGRVQVPLMAEVEDLEGDPVSVTWLSDRDGVVGSGASTSRTDLSFGRHTLTAVASDGRLTATSSSVEVEIFNEPPVVQILSPDPDNIFFERYCAGSPVAFLGRVTDPNNPPDFTVPPSNITWHLGGPENPPFATGLQAEWTFDAPGSYRYDLRAEDEQGLWALRWSRVQVDDCTGEAPTATILEPANDLQFDGHDGPDDRPEYGYNDLLLRGAAVDPEDGPLGGDALTWSARMNDGPFWTLGTGNELQVRLSSPCQGAEFTIRLVARDSDGNPSTPQFRRVSVVSLC